MQCTRCGNQISDGMPSCPNCGTPVSPYTQNQPVQNQPQGQFYGQQNQPQGQFYGQQNQPQGQFYEQQNQPQGQFYGQQNQPQGQFYGQQNQPYNQMPYGYNAPMTKKQFLKHPNIKKCHSNIKGAAIVLYVCAGITLLVGILTGNFFSIVDVILILGLALGIHLSQSRACSIVLCVYSVINLIFMLISSGTPGGWMIIVAAIYAIIYTFRFQKAWTEYQQTGIIPFTK